jgi:hypothetical protein
MDKAIISSFIPGDSEIDIIKKNKLLLANLLINWYTVIPVSGFIKGIKNKMTLSFIVINDNNVPNFINNIVKIGNMFEQGIVSVTKNNGTSYDMYLDKTENINDTSMFSGIQVCEPSILPGNGFGMWTLGIRANMKWQDIPL